MKCKKCGGKTQVTDTEESLDGFVVMRRRQCPNCGNRFKTTETIWESMRPHKSHEKDTIFHNAEGYRDETPGKAIYYADHLPPGIWKVVKALREFAEIAKLDLVSITLQAWRWLGAPDIPMRRSWETLLLDNNEGEDQMSIFDMMGETRKI